MVTTRRLSAEDRGYFRRLDLFAFSNPFSAPRASLLAELIPDVPPALREESHRTLSDAVTRKMERFDVGGTARLDDYPAEDRPLVESAYLYVAYHRFLEDLDRLIERQLRTEGPVAVWFDQDFYAHLGQRHFSEAAIGRYLSLFFQVRRAFYFIERGLPGDSPSMRRLRCDLWNNTFSHDMRKFQRHLWNRMEDFSTLLLGETGSGKGSAAAALGRSSFIPYSAERRSFVENFATAFVSLNLSQFPETLIESELFGHRKGAFTGAVKDHKGVFERCSAHGALFLDEIGELEVPIQVKLLQILQERTFTALGDHGLKRFNGRVIAATNRPLDQLRSDGRFRDDLFYRLCSDVIAVPPLRERLREAPAEIEQLVAVLVERLTGEPDAALVDEVLASLRRDLPTDYAWTGNVRELEQAVRRILLTGSYGGSERIQGPAGDPRFLASVQSGTLDALELLQGYCALLFKRYPTYVEVAKRTGLDRRTVRKYLQAAGSHLGRVADDDCLPAAGREPD